MIQWIITPTQVAQSALDATACSGWINRCFLLFLLGFSGPTW